MPDDSGYLEKRQFERVSAKTEVRFREIEEVEADHLIKTNTYKDITSTQNQPFKAVKDVMTVVTENVSAGGLKLAADKPFTAGKSLAIELILPGMPLPIKAVALVVRAETWKNTDGKYTAGLRFIGINKDDVAKVEKYISLQKR